MGGCQPWWEPHLTLLCVSVGAAWGFDSPVMLLGLPAYALFAVPVELARYATAVASGVPGPRIELTSRGLRARSAENVVTTRQLALTTVVPIVATIVLGGLAFAVLPTMYAVTVAFAAAWRTHVEAAVGRCLSHTSVFERVRDWREERRARETFATLVAATDRPGRHAAEAEMLEAAVARDPANYSLSIQLARLLAVTRRFEEAAREMSRAALGATGRRDRRRAALVWADCVLTYAEVLGNRLPAAVRLVRDAEPACGLEPVYLLALTDLRTGDVSSALDRADLALAHWSAGEYLHHHTVGCLYGIRALALLTLGRHEEARAAVAAGDEVDPGNPIPDLLDEAKAALTA